MKIVITGHTKGIGKAIFDFFSQNGHTVIGLSRSNGNDLLGLNVADHLKDADVFINNAYVKDHQTRCLKDAIEYWKDTNKLIININSKLSLMPIEEKYLTPFIKEYVANKKEQTSIIHSYSALGFKVSNIFVGLTDTEFARTVFDAPVMLQTKDVAKVVYNIVDSSNAVHIQQTIIDAPGLDWRQIKRKDINVE